VSLDVTPSDDLLTIALPAELDMTAAPSLHRLLREAVDASGDLRLDADGVSVVTSPCLQILAATALSQRARGKRFTLNSASVALRRAIEELGLTQVLPLPQAAPTA